MPINNINGQNPPPLSSSAKKVGQNIATGTNPTIADKQKIASRYEQSPKEMSVPKDENVDISDQGLKLNQLEQKIKNLPEQSSSKVVKIKSDIENGRYIPNLRETAKKIIDLDQDFL